MKIKTYKIGNHRGNGRIFLEGNLIKSSGFDCGVQYTRVDNLTDGEIYLFPITHAAQCDARLVAVTCRAECAIGNPRGVTQSVRNGKARPIIDLSDSTIQYIFAGFSRVEVEFHDGMLIYRGAK